MSNGHQFAAKMRTLCGHQEGVFCGLNDRSYKVLFLNNFLALDEADQSAPG